MSAVFRRLPRLATLTVALALLVGLPTPEATASIPADDDFEDRRVETLQAVTDNYDYQDDYSSCSNMGFSAAAMMAKLRLDEMGEPGGRSPQDAADEIENLAENAIDMAGSPGDPCTWGQAGSPATMHGALAFGYILNQWGDELPSDVFDTLVEALEGHWRGSISAVLVNGNISIVAGQLLGGEAVGYDSDLWQEGWDNFEAIYERTTSQGGIEMNSPLYGAYHFAALLPMLDLEHDEARAMARIATEYPLMVQAHQYLPGGGLGRPQARDRYYGGLDNPTSSLHRVIWYLTGSELHEPVSNIHLVGAVADYQLPEALRTIFLDKGEGYEFWTYSDEIAGPARMGWAAYEFDDDIRVSPWQTVVVPGGDAMFGLNYGFRYQAIHASMGVYARSPDDEFAILYHYQPYVHGDTNEMGGSLPSSNGDTEPDDFVRELYDFERFSHERAFISLWDPTTELKDSDVVRTHQDTRAHIPDYEAYGGEMVVDVDDSGWIVGRLSDAYVAYYPLGTIDVGPDKRSQIPGPHGDGTRETEHYYLRLDGRSGAITELATTDDFDSIDDYLDDLEDRHVEFSGDTSSSMYAEFDARDFETGEDERMRLEYHPEARFLDGQQISDQEALDHGLIDSPWVDHDDAEQTVSLFRGCNDQVVYDLDDRSVSFEAPPASECDPAGPIFSDVEFYGDARNWDYKNDERWSVTEVDGEPRLYQMPFDFEAHGDRIGEYALAEDRVYEDFTISFQARTALEMDVPNLDWVIIFGYQNPDDYYVMIANETPEYSELFVIEDGQRTRLGGVEKAMVPDQDWYEMELSREGDEIEVFYEGEHQFSVQDDTYGEGRVGVGTFNDAAYFDDIAIVTPDDEYENGDETGDTGVGEDAGDPGDAGDSADAGDTGGTGGGTTDADPTGCGCSTTGGGTPAAVVLVLVALVGIRQSTNREERSRH